jgi:hypothetical protein
VFSSLPPPILAEFDSRLTSKFFESPAQDKVGTPSRLTNISTIRKEAVSLILNEAVRSRIPPTRLKNPLLPLINLYAPILHYEKSIIPDVLTEPQRRLYELAQAGLLPVIKTQLTLEFVLWFILETKVGFRVNNLEIDTRNLNLYMERVYHGLAVFGPDPFFQKVINFDDPSECNWMFLKDRIHLIYSELMTSLLRRMVNLGYFNVDNQLVAISENVNAVVMTQCKTISLVYVIDNNQPKSLLRYVQEAGQKNVDNVITSIQFLHELMATVIPENKLAVWINSLSMSHLVKIIGNQLNFKKLCGLFTETELVEIRARFEGVRFSQFDPALTDRFFVATEVTNDNDKKLPEILMQIRRGIVAKKLLELLRDVSESSSNRKTDLTNAVLNYYALEFGINTTENDNENLINDAAIQSALEIVNREAKDLFSITHVLEYIYHTRLKTPLVNLLASAKPGSDISEAELAKHNDYRFKHLFPLIAEKLNVYGIDNVFTPILLFDEASMMDAEYNTISDKEIECQITITLIHRLANAGYVALTEYKQSKFKSDSIYYISNNSVKLAYVNQEREPLLTYTLGLTDNEIGEMLLIHPHLLSVLDYFSEERLKTFFQNNVSNAHLFVTSYENLLVVLSYYTEREAAILFGNVSSKFLENVLTSDEKFLHVLCLIPALVMESLLRKIRPHHFQNLHPEYDKFFLFIEKLNGQMHAPFFSVLKRSYLQNIHPDVHDILTTIKILTRVGIQALFKKLGDAYLQCIFNNSSRLFRVGNNVAQERYYAVLEALSDGHLMIIFQDQTSVACVEALKYKKVDFLVRLINIGCGTYKSLFTELSFLEVTLKQIVGDELHLVDKIIIDFVAVSKNASHLWDILRTLTQSNARLKFCLKLGAEITRFIWNYEQFLDIFKLFSDSDKTEFESTFPQFKVYYEKFNAFQVAKIIELMEGIDSIISKLYTAKESNKFNSPSNSSDLDVLLEAVLDMQKVAASYSNHPLQEKFTKVNQEFQKIVSTIEQTFNDQVPASGNQRFFTLPTQKILDKLNSKFFEYHFTRFLGSLLTHIYTGFPQEAAANKSTLHLMLQKHLTSLKEPLVHDDLLFLVPKNQNRSESSSSLRM